MANWNSRGTQKSGTFASFNVPPVIFDVDVYDSRYQNIKHDGSTNSQLPAPLGSYGITPDGRTFRYLRFTDTTAAAEGALVAPAASITLTTPVLSTTDNQTLTCAATNGVIFSSELAPNLVGSWVKLTWATTGKAAYRRIVDHTQSATPTILLDRPLVAAEIGTLTSELAVTVFRPYTVALAASTTAQVVGVSVGAVSITDTATSPDTDYCGWFQVKGTCPVLVDNATVTIGSGAAGGSGFVTPTLAAGVGTIFQWTTPAVADVHAILNYGIGKVVGGKDIPLAGKVLVALNTTRVSFF